MTYDQKIQALKEEAESVLSMVPPSAEFIDSLIDRCAALSLSEGKRQQQALVKEVIDAASFPDRYNVAIKEYREGCEDGSNTVYDAVDSVSPGEEGQQPSP